MLRFFHIVAIPIRIVVNNFGDHDPNGMMYVLKENEEKTVVPDEEEKEEPVEHNDQTIVIDVDTDESEDNTNNEEIGRHRLNMALFIKPLL